MTKGGYHRLMSGQEKKMEDFREEVIFSLLRLEKIKANSAGMNLVFPSYN